MANTFIKQYHKVCRYWLWSNSQIGYISVITVFFFFLSKLSFMSDSAGQAHTSVTVTMTAILFWPTYLCLTTSRTERRGRNPKTI